MKRYDTITPEGTRDLLFEECEAVKQVEQMLGRVFESRGFQEVRTPGIEFYDVFTKPASHFPQESMYKLTDTKGRLMVMRPDSTMPIARLVSTRLQGAALPLRLYYNQPVYRVQTRLTGRSDEVMQTGIELIGSASTRADLEAVVTAADALRCCGKRYRLELGHIGVFRSLIDALPTDAQTRETVRELIQSKNYPALGDLLDGIDAPASKLLRRLPRLFGGAEVLLEAEELFADCPEIMPHIRALHELYSDLVTLVDPDCILIDLGLVNPNNYYTGIVFTGYLEGRGEQVLTGGRYDRLLEDFGEPLPAVGFGIDIDAVARLLLRKTTVRPPDLLVHGLPGYLTDALRFARKQIEDGKTCEHSVFDTPEQAAEYAKSRGIGQLAIIGEQVTVTYMKGAVCCE